MTPHAALANFDQGRANEPSDGKRDKKANGNTVQVSSACSGESIVVARVLVVGSMPLFGRVYLSRRAVRVERLSVRRNPTPGTAHACTTDLQAVPSPKQGQEYTRILHLQKLAATAMSRSLPPASLTRRKMNQNTHHSKRSRDPTRSSRQQGSQVFQSWLVNRVRLVGATLSNRNRSRKLTSSDLRAAGASEPLGNAGGNGD